MKLNILFVADEFELAEELQERGHYITVAERPSRGLKNIEESDPFDVIIVDRLTYIWMGLNGVKLVQRLHEQYREKLPKVLIMCSHSDEALREDEKRFEGIKTQWKWPNASDFCKQIEEWFTEASTKN